MGYLKWHSWKNVNLGTILGLKGERGDQGTSGVPGYPGKPGEQGKIQNIYIVYSHKCSKPFHSPPVCLQSCQRARMEIQVTVFFQ
jgi:hypothetical protein